MHVRVALLLSLLSTPHLASAQERSVAGDMVHQVMSPFCPGKVLSDCPSPQAAEWRVEMHRWADEGANEAEIMSRLQARAPGFDLIRRPAPESTDAVPIAAFIAASIVLLFAVRRLVRRSRPGSFDDEESADYDERLDDELARLAD